LLEFASVSLDRFDDITRRIIAGFGLDWSNENARIDFECFCRIKSFLNFYTLSDDELIKMWIKILNPHAVTIVPTTDMKDFFERFARGRTLKEPTLVS
jgi:hypothetical protein